MGELKDLSCNRCNFKYGDTDYGHGWIEGWRKDYTSSVIGCKKTYCGACMLELDDFLRRDDIPYNLLKNRKNGSVKTFDSLWSKIFGG